MTASPCTHCGEEASTYCCIACGVAVHPSMKGCSVSMGTRDDGYAVYMCFPCANDGIEEPAAVKEPAAAPAKKDAGAKEPAAVKEPAAAPAKEPAAVKAPAAAPAKKDAAVKAPAAAPAKKDAAVKAPAAAPAKKDAAAAVESAKDDAADSEEDCPSDLEDWPSDLPLVGDLYTKLGLRSFLSTIPLLESPLPAIPGFTLPSPLPEPALTALNALVDATVQRWHEKPPKETGGIYKSYSDDIHWHCPKVHQPLMDALYTWADHWFIQSWSTDVGRIMTISLGWSEGNEPHFEETIVGRSLIYISLCQQQSYVLRLIPADCTFEAGIEVPLHHAYTMQGDVLYKWMHSSHTPKPKIGLRITFSGAAGDRYKTMLEKEEELATTYELQKEALLKLKRLRGKAEVYPQPGEAITPGKLDVLAEVAYISASDQEDHCTEDNDDPVIINRTPGIGNINIQEELLSQLKLRVKEAGYWPDTSLFRDNEQLRSEMIVDLEEMTLLNMKNTQEIFRPIDASKGKQGLLNGGEIWLGEGIQSKTAKTFASNCWALTKSFRHALQPWGHDSTLDQRMYKIIINFNTSQIQTLAFPSLTASNIEPDKREPLEKVRRGQIITIKNNNIINTNNKDKTDATTNKLMTSLLDLAVNKLTRGQKQTLKCTKEDPIPKETYDMTILFSSTNTVDHVDEPDGDGPGHIIVNLDLASDGFLIFSVSLTPNIHTHTLLLQSYPVRTIFYCLISIHSIHCRLKTMTHSLVCTLALTSGPPSLRTCGTLTHTRCSACMTPAKFSTSPKTPCLPTVGSSSLCVSDYQEKLACCSTKKYSRCFCHNRYFFILLAFILQQ